MQCVYCVCVPCIHVCCRLKAYMVYVPYDMFTWCGDGYSMQVCVLTAVLRASISSPRARLHCLWPGNLTLFAGNRRYGCSLLFHTAGTVCVLARVMLACRSFRVKLWKVGLENCICLPLPSPHIPLQTDGATDVHDALHGATQSPEVCSEHCLYMYTHEQTCTPWPQRCDQVRGHDRAGGPKSCDWGAPKEKTETWIKTQGEAT